MPHPPHHRCPPPCLHRVQTRVLTKLHSEYNHIVSPATPPGALAASVTVGGQLPTAGLLTDGRPAGAGAGGPAPDSGSSASDGSTSSAGVVAGVAAGVAAASRPSGVAADSLVAYNRMASLGEAAAASSTALARRRAHRNVPQPAWHAPWRLMRVIAGHTGAVRCVAVEPGNKWFVTGGADRTVRLWDLASGTLKLTLTGHISTVRGVVVSARHPYLFSVGEDKTVRCWDLEANKVIRKYHGHLSGVYCCALHPTLDVLMTGGRDATCRVWDIRTKAQVHSMGGHRDTVATVACQAAEPQVVTGSHDHTVKLWDLAAGKALTTLTHHKKSVRALALHPTQYTMVTASPDNIKKWRFPDANFMHNLSGHSAIINSLALNPDGVLVSAGDDGTMRLWDYDTGYAFQRWETQVQPGSLDSEAGVYACTFDQTGARLITAEADKTIKVYREDPTASPESDPIDMATWTKEFRALQRF